VNGDELRRVLEEAGRQQPPEPRADFVRDLGDRLTDTHVVTTHDHRRPVGRVVAVAASVAVIAAVALAISGGGDEQRLVTDPSSSTTSSTATTTSTSPATTTSTSTTTTPTTVAPVTTTAPPPTTTSTVAPTTTTTAPPETTTTTAAPPAPLRLTCASKQDPDPKVVCEWGEATNGAVDHYRLWKHTGDGPDQEVYAGLDHRAVDTDVRVGANLIYEVTALAADGTVLAHGDNRISCC